MSAIGGMLPPPTALGFLTAHGLRAASRPCSANLGHARRGGQSPAAAREQPVQARRGACKTDKRHHTTDVLYVFHPRAHAREWPETGVTSSTGFRRCDHLTRMRTGVGEGGASLFFHGLCSPRPEPFSHPATLKDDAPPFRMMVERLTACGVKAGKALCTSRNWFRRPGVRRRQPPRLPPRQHRLYFRSFAGLRRLRLPKAETVLPTILPHTESIPATRVRFRGAPFTPAAPLPLSSPESLSVCRTCPLPPAAQKPSTMRE